MTYEKFLEAIKETDASPVTKRIFLKRTDNYNENSYEYKGENPKEKPDNTKPYCIYSEAIVGGTSEGSCWDTGEHDVHHGYSRPEAYEELRKSFDEEFDSILQNLVPNITFLKYKALYNGVVESDGYSENEYYGNSSNHIAVLFVELKKLYDKMTEMELI